MQVRYSPVFIEATLFEAQNGIINPIIMAMPIIAKFLFEFMSIYCTFDMINPINIPNPKTCTPPNTG